MIQLSTRSLLLLVAAIASLIPITQPHDSLLALILFLLLSCGLWTKFGLSCHGTEQRGRYLAGLTIIPLILGMYSMNVAVGSGTRDITVRLSYPTNFDPATTTLHYVPLSDPDMLPFVIEHGTKIREIVQVKNASQQVQIRARFSSRSNSFGYTWDHSCQYRLIVFVATSADNRLCYGTVNPPRRFREHGFDIDWTTATEQMDEREPNIP